MKKKKLSWVKLREFVASRLVLQEMLKKILQREETWSYTKKKKKSKSFRERRSEDETKTFIFLILTLTATDIQNNNNKNMSDGYSLCISEMNGNNVRNTLLL